MAQTVKIEDFGGVYDKYVRRIYNFIYYKTHHKETAEDLTSQTFAKALNKLSDFDGERGSFSSWLYAIARNNVIDFYRTRKSNINVEDVWDLADDTDIERDIEAAQKLQKVRKYLKALKPEQREVVLLRVWGDYSYREIAEIMGKTENNCKVLFSRTMKKLREDMPLSAFLSLLLF
ncbi:MAG: RNA polymerase sigma factor [Candidatus Paceibacterota bacterium]|jgi:RNA polymerase sigma-70 factor (ECF subfamily)